MRLRSSRVTCSAASSFVLPSALLFDCDGVLVDTEKDGHRLSFNDTFTEVLHGMWIYMVNCLKWEVEKKGRQLTSTIQFGLKKAPKSEAERKGFIASLHKWKTELFMALIEKRLLPLRPGVAKVSAIVSCLLGPERADDKIKIFDGDVAIYVLAGNTLDVDPSSYTAEEDFINADAVFDCIGDRFDLAFCRSLLQKQYV
ncbi:hypothetical protein LWI29_025970 [Acer saccharum]|uniref:Uncharacterized protein n=1 Tax=Acer saccharum TaxID=4024 RepID=A0AA39RVB5_ACESA|nr:hypothetical protein LWI29_025970 [Acer saccharum]